MPRETDDSDKSQMKIGSLAFRLNARSGSEPGLLARPLYAIPGHRHAHSRIHNHSSALVTEADRGAVISRLVSAFGSMNGIQLTPFQLWLHDSLRTMGLDDGTFAPYIQALLMEASEGGVYENGGVEMTLASLCPPEQEPQVREGELYRCHMPQTGPA